MENWLHKTSVYFLVFGALILLWAAFTRKPRTWQAIMDSAASRSGVGSTADTADLAMLAPPQAGSALWSPTGPIADSLANGLAISGREPS